MTNYMDLTGKVALITGASSGIGAATAMAFKELGAKIAIGYNRNRDGAEKIASATGALAIHADVRDEGGIKTLVDTTAAQYGPIDILINNAGSLVERMKIREITAAKWDDIFRLNMTSAVLCSQAVAQSMIDRKTGAIVNIVSIAGRNGGGPGAVAYASAKAALIAFTKGLARELAPLGVRVNAVSPGVIDTPFHEVFSTPEMIRNFVAGIPLGRTGTAMECAKAIAFLASDAASYIVGETLEVNGGQLML
jgi:NAD(P)-dependent dehydrogenase (short-subunit alcohol dehydrogenase family)